MLYESRKTKKYVLIGVGAILIVALAIALFSLMYRNKMVQTSNSEIPSPKKIWWQNIQKEFEKLEAMRKSQNLPPLTQEEIQKEFSELEKQKVGAPESSSTPEQIQKEFDALDKTRK